MTASFQFLLPVNDIELLCKFSASNKAAKCQTPKILLMMANSWQFFGVVGHAASNLRALGLKSFQFWSLRKHLFPAERRFAKRTPLAHQSEQLSSDSTNAIFQINPPLARKNPALANNLIGQRYWTILLDSFAHSQI